MSFLKNLFGLGETRGDEPPASGKAIEHKGFTIRATPFKEAGQFQTSGIVEKTIDGTTRQHKFIRADRFASQDDAADFSLSKGRQLVDEQGDRLFD